VYASFHLFASPHGEPVARVRGTEEDRHRHRGSGVLVRGTDCRRGTTRKGQLEQQSVSCIRHYAYGLGLGLELGLGPGSGLEFG
jgi:hypothetical protein